ncbi:MAG: hypothetical protein HYT09_00565 [Candidatus Levybacteria bacterium]|nr:hypothetical protein [Candidatus Levybacteria bacterium]
MFSENEVTIVNASRREVMSLEPFSQEEIALLASVTDDQLKAMMSVFTEEDAREAVQEILSKTEVSIPQAISRYITGSARLFQGNALIDLNGGNLCFLVSHDFAEGMLHIATVIDIAEGEIAGKTEQMIMDTFERVDAQEEKDFTQSQVDFFLSMKSGVRQWTDLLLADPSGFQLVDGYVAHAEDEFNKPPQSRSHFIPPYYTPNFFLMGARFGRDLYKKAYKAVKEK